MTSIQNDGQPKAIPRLLSLREAAQILHVSERSVWTLAARGDLKSVRIGRRRLFDPADLAEWIAGRKTGGEK